MPHSASGQQLDHFKDDTLQAPVAQ